MIYRFIVILIKLSTGFHLYVFTELDSNSYTDKQRPETEPDIYGPLIYGHNDNSKQEGKAGFQ